ncbi:MAG: hypothetical protein H8E86_08820 [Planctomycetes bacterium]|nr:hypothetical protein [Planctomycetota bacterium]
MSQAANVRSLESLKEFRSALIKFIDEAKRAISTADSEVSHTQVWLQSTQPTHWIQAERRSNELLAQAKSELFRATISQPDNPRGPTDQIRLVKRRQAEIKDAHDKLLLTKRWSRKMERETNEYRGAITPLLSALEGSLNKAVFIIDKSIQSLESYLATSVKSSEQEISDSTNAPSIARGGDAVQEQQKDEHADGSSTTDKNN